MYCWGCLFGIRSYTPLEASECLPAWFISRIGGWGFISQLLCPLWWDFLPWGHNSSAKLWKYKVSLLLMELVRTPDQKMKRCTAHGWDGTWLIWGESEFAWSIHWKRGWGGLRECDLRDCLWLKFQGIDFRWKCTSLLRNVPKNKNWRSEGMRTGQKQTVNANALTVKTSADLRTISGAEMVLQRCSESRQGASTLVLLHQLVIAWVLPQKNDKLGFPSADGNSKKGSQWKS